jgi:hypothetical protein
VGLVGGGVVRDDPPLQPMAKEAAIKSRSKETEPRVTARRLRRGRKTKKTIARAVPVLRRSKCRPGAVGGMFALEAVAGVKALIVSVAVAVPVTVEEPGVMEQPIALDEDAQPSVTGTPTP